jgi:regulator of nonsense transcripts 3
VFQDAAKSFQDPALVGPPALEFAPYPKLPGSRRRSDARQGTIDQDPEFKEFLESLTAPITKPAAPEEEPQKEKVKTTPLIEALREKKANKDKPQGKRSAKEEATDKKLQGRAAKEAASASASADKGRKLTKTEREKAQKEAVRALNSQASAIKDAASSSTDKTNAPERKRGNVSIAKSMLQRDLGIGPAAPNKRRGAKRELTSAAQETSAKQDENATGKQKAKEALNAQGAAGTASENGTSVPSKKERPSRSERRAFHKAGTSLVDKTNNKTVVEDSKASTKPTAAPMILKKPQTTQAQAPMVPKGPAATRAPPTEPAAARNTPGPSQSSSAVRPPNPTPNHSASASSTSPPTGKQAFLKHANASQGITEPLIEEALKVFGAVEKVEIDKRKGFAYVDFADSKGLANAIAASPVTVAQGAVQILERKEKVARRAFAAPPVGPARGRGGFGPRGRGGRGGARGGAHVSSGAGAVDTAQAPAPVPVAPAGGDAAT